MDNDGNDVPYLKVIIIFTIRRNVANEKKLSALVGISFAREERANVAEGWNWRVFEIDKSKCQFELSYGAKGVPGRYNDC